MNKTSKMILAFALGFGLWLVAQAQQAQLSKPPSAPPSFPKNFPAPPFGVSKSDNGKFQLVSAEYYSQDEKPYLYKRLVKVDTTTGKAWVLHSARGGSGEIRQWLPLTEK